MFRQFVVILLLIAFTAHSFQGVVIVLDYYANKATYAQNCENKAKPVMRCHGKCQMMKKLKEEENKDRQSGERKGGNKAEWVTARSSSKTFIFHTIDIHLLHAACLHVSFPKGVAADIFHPPALV